ncbi:hypothetical protein [Micromonospora sp. NBC_01796]|uniref:hypothetical protein n=1 Tax=Micromonospora sp. NBC_01796 TaxID=2975987 RepID=UPI002DD9CDA3|nr:hypothetical protein [Micromonospora sp. NBC_01796]WSA87738.1 hypothetical protein OIE47_09090 [Micromonospora sp. NBC_01796]
MAFRTWGRVLLVALGVGVLAGAGQLGFAYGFGIVRFARTFDTTAASQWTAQLAWVSWFTMVAAVVGAVIADRLARRYDYHPTLGTRLALAGAAALGAGAVAPLSMQPARAAQVAAVDPVLAAGLVAGLGALVGFAAAVAALHQSPVSWNVAVITAGIWVLALISVMPSLGPTDPLPAVRLGVPDPAWLSAGSTQRLAVVTMPALALVAGALTGVLARLRGHSTVVVASTGAVGPAMLALSYLAAGPGDSADKYQAAPYWGALIAVAAGALGSVLAAVMRWPLTSETATPTPLQPTEILQRVRTPEPVAESPTETWTSRSTDQWTDRPTEPRSDHLSTDSATGDPTRPWNSDLSTASAAGGSTQTWKDDLSTDSSAGGSTQTWKDHPTELWSSARSGDTSSDQASEPTIPSPRRSRETDYPRHSSPATAFLAPASADYAASKAEPLYKPEPVNEPEPASKPASPTRFETTIRSESTDPGDSDLLPSPAASAIPVPPIPAAPTAATQFPSSVTPAPSFRPSAAASPLLPPPLTPAPPAAAPPAATTTPAAPTSGAGSRPTADPVRPAAVTPLPAPAPVPAPRSPASDALLSPTPDSLLSPTSDPLRTPKPDPLGTPNSDPLGTPKSDPLGSPKSGPLGTTPEPPSRRPEPEWADPTLATMSTADFWPSSADRHKPFEERTDSGWDAFAAAGRTDTPAPAPEPTGRSSRDTAHDQDLPRTESRQPVAPPEPLFKAPEPVATSKPYPTPEPLTTSKPYTAPEPAATSKPYVAPEPIATSKPYAAPEPVTANDPSTPPEPVRKTPFRLGGSTSQPTPPATTSPSVSPAASFPSTSPATSFPSTSPATSFPSTSPATSFPSASSSTTRPEPTEPSPDRTPPGTGTDLGATKSPLPWDDNPTERQSEKKAEQEAEEKAVEAEQPAEEKAGQTAGGKTEQKAARPRRGLFRRNRSSDSKPDSESTTGTDTGGTAPEPPAQRGRGRAERPVSATDEEYVDWVSGLGAPSPAEPPSPDAPRRTLRSSGRHHAD